MTMSSDLWPQFLGQTAEYMFLRNSHFSMNELPAHVHLDEKYFVRPNSWALWRISSSQIFITGYGSEYILTYPTRLQLSICCGTAIAAVHVCGFVLRFLRRCKFCVYLPRLLVVLAVIHVWMIRNEFVFKLHRNMAVSFQPTEKGRPFLWRVTVSTQCKHSPCWTAVASPQPAPSSRWKLWTASSLCLCCSLESAGLSECRDCRLITVMSGVGCCCCCILLCSSA